MNEQQLPLRAATYVRVADDPAAILALETKQTHLATFAAAQGLTRVAMFSDRGPANQGLAERPGLTDLVTAVGTGEVEVVIVEHEDQLSEDPVWRELIVHELRTAGVAVLLADSGQDLTAPEQAEPADPATRSSIDLIRDVVAAAAVFGSHAGIVALRKARTRTPAIEFARAEILRMRERKLSFISIARHLNAQGLRDPHDAPWSRTSVVEFLRSQPTSDRSPAGE